MRNETHKPGEAGSFAGADAAGGDLFQDDGRPATVSRDMEGIFGPARNARASGRRRQPDAIVSLASRRPRSVMIRRVGAFLAASLGLAAVSGAVWFGLRAPATAPVSPERLVAAVPAAPPPPARPTSPPSPQANFAQVVAPEPAASPAPRRVEAKPKPTPARFAVAEAPVRAAANRPERTRNEGECSGLRRAARSQCLRPKLLRADEDMRGAYDRAIRAGIDPGMLMTYRDRWSEQLAISDAHPADATAAIEEMTRELDRHRIGL